MKYIAICAEITLQVICTPVEWLQKASVLQVRSSLFSPADNSSKMLFGDNNKYEIDRKINEQVLADERRQF